MQELLTFVAQSLVEHPDQVSVTETEGPEAIILELHVAEEDMGKVIGKQGRIAKAIRAVVKAATANPAVYPLPTIHYPLSTIHSSKGASNAVLPHDRHRPQAPGHPR